MACGFVALAEHQLFKVAVRYQYPLGSASRARHINAKELGAIEKAARWATHRSELRGRRLVVQTDSAVSTGVLRKGRSSKRALKGTARRLLAVCIAERLELIVRWILTDRNMADQPSCGSPVPGPCLGLLVVRRRSRGLGGYAGTRMREAKKPGRPEFWGPLLAANVNEQTLTVRYGLAVVEFLKYVQREPLLQGRRGLLASALYPPRVSEKTNRAGHAQGPLSKRVIRPRALLPSVQAAHCIAPLHCGLGPASTVHAVRSHALGRGVGARRGHVPRGMPGCRCRAAVIVRLLAPHF